MTTDDWKSTARRLASVEPRTGNAREGEPSPLSNRARLGRNDKGPKRLAVRGPALEPDNDPYVEIDEDHQSGTLSLSYDGEGGAMPDAMCGAIRLACLHAGGVPGNVGEGHRRALSTSCRRSLAGRSVYRHTAAKGAAARHGASCRMPRRDGLMHLRTGRFRQRLRRARALIRRDAGRPHACAASVPEPRRVVPCQAASVRPRGAVSQMQGFSADRQRSCLAFASTPYTAAAQLT